MSVLFVLFYIGLILFLFGLAFDGWFVLAGFILILVTGAIIDYKNQSS